MTAGSNIPELTVSELAFSLKRTLEETYGRVRVRGELSKVKIHTSGHLYSDLKDADSVLSIVCWRSTLAKLTLKPEEGLEVICTGKITTYPARSNYQLVVDRMELAGEGALLKMLEDRKKRLAAEGLFDESRKRRIPFLPGVIGVVTSPTGAVIRDILHRLEDRFPRRVIVWPVRVQGEGAAEEISTAIRGFSDLKPGGPVPRPDLVIVARGGGSLEDLMAFNEENVVRAAASCSIPLISAVGHETDTTLIDFAADLRAPTPTAAAEMAVPERLSLLAQVADDAGRLRSALARLLREKRQEIAAWAARLGDPARLLDLKIQALDHAADRLSHALSRRASAGQERLLRLAGRLVHPRQILQQARQSLQFQSARLSSLGTDLTNDPRRKLDHAGKMLEALSFRGVLARGYAVVRAENGEIVAKAARTTAGQSLLLEFADGTVKTQVEESPQIS
jgi:exodeoxyribonuclease VII large subunit